MHVYTHLPVCNMHMHTHPHKDTHTQPHTYSYTHRGTHMHTYTYMHLHAHPHVHTHAHVRTPMHAHTHPPHTYTYAHTHMHAHTHAYAYTHTHTPACLPTCVARPSPSTADTSFPDHTVLLSFWTRGLELDLQVAGRKPTWPTVSPRKPCGDPPSGRHSGVGPSLPHGTWLPRGWLTQWTWFTLPSSFTALVWFLWWPSQLLMQPPLRGRTQV